MNDAPSPASVQTASLSPRGFRQGAFYTPLGDIHPMLAQLALLLRRVAGSACERPGLPQRQTSERAGWRTTADRTTIGGPMSTVGDSIDLALVARLEEREDARFVAERSPHRSWCRWPIPARSANTPHSAVTKEPRNRPSTSPASTARRTSRATWNAQQQKAPEPRSRSTTPSPANSVTSQVNRSA